MSVVGWQVTGWFRMASLTRLVVSRLSAGVKEGTGRVPLIRQARLPQTSSWGSSVSRITRAETTKIEAQPQNWHTLAHAIFPRSKQITRLGQNQVVAKWI